MKARATWLAVTCVGLLMLFARPTAATHLCPGDFDGDEQVTVDEIIGSVHCAFEGCPVRFVDNGDGTITDQWTRLMWEKKTADGSMHDWQMTWTVGWKTVPVSWLNNMAFAGYTDWRLPNTDELHDLVDYGRTSSSPLDGLLIDPLFDENCLQGCSGTECSCTGDASYWSADSYSVQLMWAVNFMSGEVHLNSQPAAVRAVRGGY